CPKSAEAPEGFKRRFLTFGASIKRMVGGTRRMYTGDLKRNPQEYKKELALYKKAGHVWISYGVPFIIPITAGFVTALVFGDILFTIIRCITGAM
ncbi:MAG: peptidase A24, partial [Methanomicrobium sp.]|nr:peptidase A24 [Methanomicrobium sp.]